MDCEEKDFFENSGLVLEERHCNKPNTQISAFRRSAPLIIITIVATTYVVDRTLTRLLLRRRVFLSRSLYLSRSYMSKRLYSDFFCGSLSPYCDHSIQQRNVLT
ncbi:hypothetical protein RND81_01G152100 [Saponaria officinalis]|uniref:Transmembrane protein n=1 Tax=Saponaria officinalis TaxID=3572 RepID=A0AAW1NFZ8_SAPOF